LAGSRPTRVVAALVAAAVWTGAAPGAGAQRSRPYRPAFDVSDYALTLDLPDTGSTIHANALITVARVARADTLRLDLLDLDVNAVSVDGRAAKFNRTHDGVDIVLPSRKATTATFEVNVEYGGAVKDGLIVRQDSAGRWTYFGDNWPNRARHWIPSIDHPSDKATVTWRVRAPAARTIIANGRLVSRKPMRDASGGDRVETVWRESKPIAPYLMVIAAAPLVEYDVGDTACGLAELQRCVPQLVYVAPEQRNFLPGPFARVGEIVQLFSTLVGPFPYEKLAHLQSSTRFGGMENASAIFYADGGFRRGTMRDGVVAHETAHQWFGDAVTERDWPHLWLSEGFATYFAALWTRAARGDSAFRSDMANIRRTVLNDSGPVTHHPVIDTVETNLMALLNANSYQKGGFVLHMLRQQIGEGAFFSALREYYRKNRHSTALTDDLQSEMEQTSKQQLGWFFDQWLRKPGYPTVQATWRYDTGNHQTVIDLAQSGSFGDYDFPITVAATDSAGATHRVSGRMKPNGGPIQLRIPTATSPAAVVLDPDVELLAVLRVTP
jgi:aminopeptidase N